MSEHLEGSTSRLAVNPEREPQLVQPEETKTLSFKEEKRGLFLAGLWVSFMEKEGLPSQT